MDHKWAAGPETKSCSQDEQFLQFLYTHRCRYEVWHRWPVFMLDAVPCLLPISLLPLHAFSFLFISKSLFTPLFLLISIFTCSLQVPVSLLWPHYFRNSFWLTNKKCMIGCLFPSLSGTFPFWVCSLIPEISGIISPQWIFTIAYCLLWTQIKWAYYYYPVPGSCWMNNCIFLI